jgi:cysteine synthase
VRPGARASCEASTLEQRLLTCGAGHPERLGSSICHLIGRTPALSLLRFGSDAPRAELIAKLESRNPGGSVKDRTALGMILDAEARGALRPGVRIVEATAGNTGIGLALVGRAFGHDVVLVMPERYSSEKVKLCRALGAKVVTIPGPTVGMRECIDEARGIAAREGGVILDQFSNPANPTIHELTTGVEMEEHAGDHLDAVVIGVGTGGTLTGVVRRLRRKWPHLVAVAVESQGSLMGGGPAIPTRVEGIGNSFLPDNLDMALVTRMVRVGDEDAYGTALALARSEGLLAGASSGAILFAALEVARELGPGRRVMTLLPDGGDRYWSKGLYELA